MDEGDGSVSQSCDGVLSVSLVLDLVRGGAPIEIEEQVRLGSNLPTRYQGGAVG